MFFEDLILGKGIMTLPDDSTYFPQSLIYFIQALIFHRLDGVFDDGRLNDDGTYSGFNGTGTRKFVDGDIFVGMYVNGIEYGKGVYTYSDGEIHEGSFVDNNRRDQKTNIFGNQIHTGFTSDGIFNGQGTIRFPNGDRYIPFLDIDF
jgi:hypothetical protein